MNSIVNAEEIHYNREKQREEDYKYFMSCIGDTMLDIQFGIMVEITSKPALDLMKRMASQRLKQFF